MKKLISMLGLMLALSPAAHALELRVAPLALEAQAEVLGVSAKVDGKAAIVFAGKAAEIVADAAGFAIDSSVETVVATGKEVDKLVGRTIGDVATVGGTVIITARSFGENALKIVLGDVKSGRNLAIDTTRNLTNVTKTVTKTLVRATKGSVTFVVDSGDRVIDFGAKILGKAHKSALKALRLIGFPF